MRAARLACATVLLGLAPSASASVEVGGSSATEWRASRGNALASPGERAEYAEWWVATGLARHLPLARLGSAFVEERYPPRHLIPKVRWRGFYLPQPGLQPLAAALARVSNAPWSMWPRENDAAARVCTDSLW